MATIAEQLIGTISQSSQQAPDYAGSMVKGAQLAATAEQIQTQRAEVERQKQQLEATKIEQVAKWYENAAKMPEGAARKSFIKNYIPQGINALGLGDKISPTVQEMLAAEPLMPGYLRAQIRDGKMTEQDVYGALADPAKMAELMQKHELDKYGGEVALRTAVSDYGGKLAEAGKFHEEKSQQMQRTREMAAAQLGKQIQGQGAAGQVEASKQVAKSFEDYTSGGGRAGFDTNISRLEGVLKKLESGQVKSGGISNYIPGLNSDAIQSGLNPDQQAVKNDARSALLPLLRQTLGAQFTEGEGERILNSIYDPKLDNKENARRVRNKINDLRTNVADKEATFKEYGFKVPAAKQSGTRKSVDLRSSRSAYDSLPSAEQKKFLEGAAKKYDLTVEEIRKSLMGE